MDLALNNLQTIKSKQTKQQNTHSHTNTHMLSRRVKPLYCVTIQQKKCYFCEKRTETYHPLKQLYNMSGGSSSFPGRFQNIQALSTDSIH